MVKFKEFRRGYQPWEHEGGGGSILGAGGGGGDMHASALDHDFVSTYGAGDSALADPWEGIAEVIDTTGWGCDSMEKAAAGAGAWLKREGAKSLLEVGCALGRTTRRLLKDGFKVTALEASPALVARAKLNAKGAKIEENQLIELPSGPFDAVVSLRSAFSRLTTDGQAELFLAAARAGLKPKGLLSVSFFNRDALDEETLNKTAMSKPLPYKGKQLLVYDLWQAHPDGGDRFRWAPLFAIGDYSIDWLRRSIPYKFWKVDEIKRLVKQAGFEVVGAFDANDGTTPASSSSRRVELRARAK
jgi:SAM-dependent methyltransferase